MMDPAQIAGLSWPAEQLGDALRALAETSRLKAASGELTNPLASQTAGDGLRSWIPWADERLGMETSALDLRVRGLKDALAGAYPALLRLPGGRWLAVCGCRRRKLRVVTPAFEVESIPIRDIAAALREPAEHALRTELTAMLSGAGVAEKRQARTVDLLVDEQTGGKRIDRCWIFRSHVGQGRLRLLAEAGALHNGAGLIVAHTAQYLLWLAAWGVLGSLSLSGRLDRGWLLAWALLIATLIPFQLATTWLQGVFAIALGGWLKRQLLMGSLKLSPDEIRHRGMGSFLGQVLEAEAIEILSVSGGIAGVLAAVEIAMAMFLLKSFAWVLAGWCMLAIVIGWRFLRRFSNWTTKRMEITQDLVENMVGHRTRLAQQRPAEWHTKEDWALDGYFGLSRRLDLTGAWLIGMIPRGWLLIGLACMAPSIVGGRALSAQSAVLLGGVLLAYQALRKLAGSFSDVAAGWVSWRRVKPLLDAAARTEELGDAPQPVEASVGQKLAEADRLAFRHRATGPPTLRGCSLTIRSRDRILIEGPSGGGKTTFCALLAGLRVPESGLLLVNGLDRHTLGARNWRRHVAAAPQFHENYILTETLAFNLLMGRGWPPAREDVEEAETVCRELGLGALLDEMPSGLLEMVGEGGWQLSHGEKSRIFIARALLQKAPLVILDESFAALDPENAKRAMETTLRRADTLMVIAHP